MCLAGCKCRRIMGEISSNEPLGKNDVPVVFCLQHMHDDDALKHLILTSHTKHSHCSMNNSQGDNLTSHFTYLLPFDAFCLSAKRQEFCKMVQYSQNKF